ncbi:MAG: MMPL family transporter [Deltaproteobacteria bacterium]|nr:MMPL family transporter [Deltaproteobacteria bacterium]
MFAVLLVIGVILTAQTRVEHDTLAEFRKSSPIRQADNLLNAHFGGTSQTNVVIDAGEDGGIQDPALLAKIEGLRKHVLELPEVGFTESVVDYIKRMNYAMHEQDPAYRRLPRETEEAVTDEGERVPVAGRDLIAQYLVLYEMGGGEELERIVDAGRRRANIFVNVRSYSSAVLGRVLRHVKEYVAENFAPPVRVNYSGTGAVQLELVKALVTGQIRSLLLSITVVFLCVVLIFRSFTYGLLGILPLGMTILLNFSIMVLSGIPLNVGTALIASISIGTGVDYAIHFLHRYRIEAGRGGGDHAETVHRTMRTAGRAIMLNAPGRGPGVPHPRLLQFHPDRGRRHPHARDDALRLHRLTHRHPDAHESLSADEAARSLSSAFQATPLNLINPTGYRFTVNSRR